MALGTYDILLSYLSQTPEVFKGHIYSMMKKVVLISNNFPIIKIVQERVLDFRLVTTSTGEGVTQIDKCMH